MPVKPEDFDALLALPGVGRKSANLIMGDVFGKPAIVTDTHCIRLTNRMGLVDGITEPKKVEMALWELIPPDMIYSASVTPVPYSCKNQFLIRSVQIPFHIAYTLISIHNPPVNFI